MCTINDSHIMYDSWNMECNRQFFCHFGPFLPFYPPPPTNPKNQNFKNEKNAWRCGDIIILYKCTTNHDMLHCSWYTMIDLILIFTSGLFFALSPLPPLPHHSSSTTQKIKIKKRKEKMPGDIIILHISNKHNDHMMYGSCSMVRNGQMDRQTDRKKTYWGGCPT